MGYRDKFVQVNGLKLRYIEEGRGPAVLLPHGASLGSSADVWEQILSPLASHGFRGRGVAYLFDHHGGDPASRSPEQVGAHIGAEFERLGKVVKASGARID